MKRETKLGMIIEIIYLLAVIGIVSLLLRLEVIPAEKELDLYLLFSLSDRPLARRILDKLPAVHVAELEEISFAYTCFGGYSCVYRSSFLLNRRNAAH